MKRGSAVYEEVVLRYSLRTILVYRKNVRRIIMSIIVKVSLKRRLLNLEVNLVLEVWGKKREEQDWGDSSRIYRQISMAVTQFFGTISISEDVNLYTLELRTIVELESCHTNSSVTGALIGPTKVLYRSKGVSCARTTVTLVDRSTTAN